MEMTFEIAVNLMEEKKKDKEKPADYFHAMWEDDGVTLKGVEIKCKDEVLYSWPEGFQGPTGYNKKRDKFTGVIKKGNSNGKERYEESVDPIQP
jgi:hypothetical protein